MKHSYALTALFAGLIFPVMTILPADARPAKCYNSNDGYYRCNFQSFGGNGSFVISAWGYPTITLEMIQRGRAVGTIEFNDGRYRSMPGTYIRSRKDRACWINSASIAQVCAWGL